MCIHVSVCSCVQASAGTHRGQERASDQLGQELWAAVNSLTSVMETELRSSARAGSTLNAKPCLQPVSCHILWFNMYISMKVSTAEYLFMYLQVISLTLKSAYSDPSLSLEGGCSLCVFLLRSEPFLDASLSHTQGLFSTYVL